MRSDPGPAFARPSYREWGLILAQAVATRGDCRRRKIGAIILDKNHRIIGAGYNGSPPGAPGCLEGHCPRGFMSSEEVPPDSPYTGGRGECIALHAEVNALMDAGRQRLTSGCVMYCSDKPCPDCEKLIAGFGIDVIWGKPDVRWFPPTQDGREARNDDE